MPDNNLIGKTIDHFRVERFLGQGGMAAVYEATDLRLQRQVAIKIMHAHLASQGSFRERFMNEAQAAASLDHPNIVRVNTFTKDEANLYLVMELIPGGNLRQYIKQLHEQGKFIDYPEAVEIVRQLAGALHYAHGRRMVHRDIKPDNIMLKPLQHEEGGLNYRPVITDFGLAKLTIAGEDEATAEQPIGTYPYMSPEQINAEVVDARTDIYALGIMLYELSVGRLPYNPKTIAEAARMHGRDPLPLPTELRRGFPERLEEIIVKALEKDRDSRFNSAAEMAKALTAVTQEKKAQTVEMSRSALFNYMDQYDTDVQTSIMPEPIAPHPSEPVPERKARDKEYDCLYFTNGEDGFIHRLVRERTTIGRAARQDVSLESNWLSREHAVLERKPNGKYYLLDLSESNGIWTESYKLRKDTPVILQPNAIFRMGDYWMQFLPREEVIEKATPPQTPAPVSRDDAVVEPDLSFIDDPDYSTDAGDTKSVTIADNMPSTLTAEELPKPIPVDEEQYEAATLEQINAAQVRARVEQERKMKEIREEVRQQTEQQQALTTSENDVPDSIDGIDTQLLGIMPLYEMPRDDPPELRPYQFGFDRLIIFRKNELPRLILLEESTYTVGRDPANDLVFNSPHVSAFHARIELESGFYFITDLESMNGTWFENERLSANMPTRLSASKVLRIGDYWITFEGRRDVTSEMMIRDDLDDTMLKVDDTADDTIDTAVMVRPLEEEMPYYSQPPMNNELRETDRLVFYSEDHPLKIEPITKEITTIGRGSNQDIRLDGKRVSRQHLVLEIRRNGNLYLRDVGDGSTNGTWIEDIKLVADTDVIWGRDEVVRIGNYWMKFEAGVKLIDPGTLQDDRGLIGKTVGTYQVDRFIGKSHISSVYKATDLQLGRDVSLKVLDPLLAQDSGQRQRFLEEARILSRLDHPNVVKVMSYNRADNEVFMVQELITGGTLRGVLQGYVANDSQMDLRDAVDLVVQMANGLHYAHQQGLIHRDVKPENIVLKTAGVVGPLVKYTPVLTDFSIARYARTEDLYDDEGDTSFAYISPESSNGERTDIRSDIYELGIVLFELLAGHPPYRPLSIAEAIRMHTREPIPRVSERRPGIPLDLEAVVIKALQKTPNDRYQTGIDFARALQRILPILEADAGDMESLSQVQDVDVTQIMIAPLARYMPLLTQPPRSEGEALHDRLVLYSEQYPTKVFDLDKPIFTIGRGGDQDILLESRNVSRRHARIERSPDNIYRIVDVGSANGSWLGSYKLIENVIEIWDLEETVRIADYWLRIESKDDINGVFMPEIPEPMPEDLDKELALDNIGPPVIHHPAPDHDKIQVVTNMSTLTVQAGSSITMSVEVVNLSDFVDHFEVHAIGLPPDWVTQPTQTLDLLPGNRETTSITFHPPRASTSSEGHHAFEVRVTAEAKGISAVRTQCSLTILPFNSYTTSIYPDRLRNKGKVELQIHNTSNTFATFTIAPRDREAMLHFNLEGTQYQLPPGYTESIIIDVNPQKRPWFGREQNYGYEIVASPVPVELAGGPQTQRGDLTVFPRLRIWYFIPLVLLTICLLISLAVFTFSRGQEAIGWVTETAVAEATLNAATQTAIAVGDDDGDGLPNNLEATLQTFPDLADTDEDGLTDGQEIRIWNTDPLNRDTDNDTLSDGDEVNIYGTSPTLADTDGDGILDAQDLFPGQAATPTITPFPTLEGGDICPNSPIPSRVSVGSGAIVEAGGVANRIRSEASTTADIVGYMEPGQAFQVIGGPTCDPETLIRFWKVDFNGLQGWTAEGEGEEYYIAPPEGDSGENSDGDSSGTTTDTTTSEDTSSNTTTNNAPTTADLNAGVNEETAAVSNTLASLPPAGTVSVARDDIGIQLLANVNSNLMSNAVDGLTPLSMGWVKLQASWEALQPNGPEVTSQLLTLQSHINLLKSNGYKVLVSVVKAPTWARSTSVEDGPPDNLDDLETFLGTLMQLSGGQIDAIEIWNEPNLLREWNTATYPFTGSGYMQLFDRAYNTIRQYSDSVIIVTAGLAPTGNSSVSIQDRQYLRQMYNAGLANYQNIALGVHPYGWANSPDSICCDQVGGNWNDQPQFFFLNTIATYKAITESYGHSTELWLTEFGWTTWSDLPYDPTEPWMSYLTTSQQVDYTIRAFEIGSALDYVGPMFLWNFNFANTFTLNNRDEMAGYSLVISDEDFNFQPRALYNALLTS